MFVCIRVLDVCSVCVVFLCLLSVIVMLCVCTYIYIHVCICVICVMHVVCVMTDDVCNPRVRTYIYILCMCVWEMCVLFVM